LAGLVGADVDLSFLDAPDPEGKDAVQDGVDGDCDGSVVLRGLEAELVVPVEGRGADSEG
jgi:hypothetical protein